MVGVFFWVGMDPLLGKRGRKVEKPLLWPFRRRRIRELLKTLKMWIKQSKNPLCITSWGGLGCTQVITQCSWWASLIGWVQIRESIVFGPLSVLYNFLASLYVSCMLLCNLLLGAFNRLKKGWSLAVFGGMYCFVSSRRPDQGS